MTIGEKIKELRLKKGVTQEKVAEYLAISCQSVSKWENNLALPDITLVVPLANYFGVTADELFDRHGSAEAEIAEIDRKSLALRNRGEVGEILSLWREAVQKYPGNFHCLCELMMALDRTVNCPDYTETEWIPNAKEAVLIGERILRDCTDEKIREQALSTLTYLYANNQSGVADEEKAVTCAKLAGCIWNSTEILLEQAYFTEEGEKKALRQRHENALSFLNMISLNLVRYDLEPEERIFQIGIALKLWDTLVYDGNLLFYHSTVSYLWEWKARSYAQLGNREKTLDAMKQCLLHAKAYDDLPDYEQHFTALTVCEAISNKGGSTKNYTGSDVDLKTKHFRESAEYAFLREDADYQALLGLTSAGNNTEGFGAG
jgi:transcriptional regulator with XRE-family HTH domain